MPLPRSTQLTSKSPAQYRDDILRTVRNGLVAKGIDNPDVGRDTFYYDLANALAIQLGVNANNATIMADNQMPDSAFGDDLARIAKLYGLTLRGPVGSVGHVRATSSVYPVAIAAGSELIDENGNRYRVTVGGSFTAVSIEFIPVEAIDTGSATNLAEDSVLRWVSAPAFVSSKAYAEREFEGGAEQETDEGLRARLLAYLKNPPGSGNATQIAQWAEDSGTFVQKAFVYPCFLGPGSVKVVVVAERDELTQDRDVTGLNLDGLVRPYVVGLMPEYVYTQVTTVTKENVDCSLYLALDSDGGWLDSSPFPTPSSSGPSPDRCPVTSVTSGTVIQVRSATAPVAGLSRVCWLSDIDFKLKRAVVSSFTSDGSNLYTLTLSAPFVDVYEDCLIMPDATYMEEYCETLLDYFGSLGPGEITTNVSLLPRALRHPLTSKQWPSSLGPSVSKMFAALNVGGREEVLDTAWGYRSQTSPTVPAALISNPNILAPLHCAFYPLES